MLSYYIIDHIAATLVIDEINERTRLTDTSSRDPVSWNNNIQPLEIEAKPSPTKKRENRGDNYYQRIIDEAHGYCS
jgi:hypothetical protein